MTLAPVVTGNAVDSTAVNSDIPIKTRRTRMKTRESRNDHSLQVSRCVINPRTTLMGIVPFNIKAVLVKLQIQCDNRNTILSAYTYGSRESRGVLV